MCAEPMRAHREILYALLGLSCLAGPSRIYSFLTTPSLLLPLHVWDPTLSSFPRIKNPTQYSPLLTPHPASPYLDTIDLTPSRSWGRYIFGHLLVPKKLPDPKLLPHHTLPKCRTKARRTELGGTAQHCVYFVCQTLASIYSTLPQKTQGRGLLSSSHSPSLEWRPGR